jgi:glycosyltransferase involved in cell wall biosynthesis
VRDHPRIAFLVNGPPGCAMSVRAREFATRLSYEYECRILHRGSRKFSSIAMFVRELRAFDADLVYVIDLAYSGVAAAMAYRAWCHLPWILDTGDAVSALARSVGGRGWLGEKATDALEWSALRCANALVVRGTFHQQSLRSGGFRATVVQDGVDVERCQADADVSELRRALNLEGCFTVGILGSSLWSERLQSAVGWELVELLRHVRDLPLKAILIGDGSGIPHLRKRCRQYGVEDRMVFIDRVPYNLTHRYLRLLDVAVSTQTNDAVGWSRTTGKLPLYMAAGRYVLATDVGEATLVLPACMRVPYVGVRDEAYPERLAVRLRELMKSPDRESLGASLVERCKEAFDYDVLTQRLRSVLHSSLAGSV